MNEIQDIVIVGAGPAGITAAIYALRAGLKVKIFDGGLAGGTLNSLKRIENYPGFVSVDGPALAREMADQLRHYGGKLEPHYISGIINGSPLMAVVGNEVIEAKYAILASGLKRNKPAYAHAYEGKGVSYCAVCDGNFYKGKITAVIGNGEAAYEDAAYLAGLCEKVYLISENDALATPNGVTKLIGKVTTLTGKDSVEALTYNDGESHTISVDGVFIATGAIGGGEIIRDLKSENGFILTDENYKTNFDNIYAVGDVVKGSLKQIVTACAMGAIASSDIIKRLKI